MDILILTNLIIMYGRLRAIQFLMIGDYGKKLFEKVFLGQKMVSFFLILTLVAGMMGDALNGRGFITRHLIVLILITRLVIGKNAFLTIIIVVLLEMALSSSINNLHCHSQMELNNVPLFEFIIKYGLKVGKTKFQKTPPLFLPMIPKCNGHFKMLLVYNILNILLTLFVWVKTSKSLVTFPSIQNFN